MHFSYHKEGGREEEEEGGEGRKGGRKGGGEEEGGEEEKKEEEEGEKEEEEVQRRQRCREFSQKDLHSVSSRRRSLLSLLPLETRPDFKYWICVELTVA